MKSDQNDVIGFRGERVVELCLTNYRALPGALFMPGFLGGKWPTIDFYVELIGVPNCRPYFFVQVKATTAALTRKSTALAMSISAQTIERLLQIPAPTYILRVHEPSERVFVRSVHEGVPVRGMTRIPISHELTSGNLQTLYNEVREFWLTKGRKPNASVFT